jgi:hypothetical protein
MVDIPRIIFFPPNKGIRQKSLFWTVMKQVPTIIDVDADSGMD